MPLNSEQGTKDQRSRKTYAKPPSEGKESLALVKWAYTHPILRDILVHIPNEGKRHPNVGFNLVAKGLRAGVSDFFIPYPTKSYHGLWIELKKTKYYKIQPNQIEWIERMKSLGYAADFAYGWEDAKNKIEDYLRDFNDCR
jgi:VRR-NUC domain-containing protein